MSGITWPTKTREMHNHHFDSTVWNDLEPRDDDIVISTYAKSGTTWVQQIVAQLLFQGEEGLPVAEMSPWVDLRVPPKPVKLEAIEAQPHRRFLKTHLPVDALVYHPQVKYIYIARDPRDVVWSMHNHHFHANEKWYGALNGPGLVGPPIEKPPEDVRQYFIEWVEKDGHPWWPYWENVRTWWAIRDLPNLHVLHFADLKRDMPGEIRRIAEFIEVDVDDETFERIVRHCSFDYMKAHATASTPLGGIFWDEGATRFVHKGTRGQWRGTLTDEDLALYRETRDRELEPELAHWIEHGSYAEAT